MSKALVVSLSLFITFKVSYGQHVPAQVYYKDGRLQNDSIYEPFAPSHNRLLLKNNGMIHLDDIDRVSIDSISYFSKEIIDQSHRSFLLLERVIHGKVSLYRTPHKDDRTTFFIEKEGNVRKLQIIQKKIDQHTISRKDQYKSVLRAVLYDCPEVVQDQINQTKLNYSSLKNILTTYNRRCGWSNYVKEPVPSSQRNISLHVLTGYSWATIPLEYSLPYIMDARYRGFSEVVSNKMFYGFGLALKVKRFSVTNNILLESFDVEKTYINSRERDREAYRMIVWNLENQLVYQFLDIRDQVAIRFHFLERGKVSAYVGLGMSFNYVLSNKSYYAVQGEVDNDNRNSIEVVDYHKNLGELAKRFRSTPFPLVGLTIGRVNVHGQSNLNGGYVVENEKPYSEYSIQLSYTIFD